MNLINILIYLGLWIYISLLAAALAYKTVEKIDDIIDQKVN